MADAIDTRTLRVLRLVDGVELPRYMTTAAAGIDLAAAPSVDFTLHAGHRALVSTGLAIALPPGTEAQVRPRSGLAVKQGITVLNAPGTIDADYRGEIKVALINLGQDSVKITGGMRIAQLVVAPVLRVAIVPVDDLDDTDRGTGGFGHTG